MEYKEGRLKGMAMLASIGLNLVAATFIGFLIGFYLDKYLGTAPWLTILFLFFGIASGFRNMFTVAKKYGELEDKGDGDGSGKA